MSESTRYYAIEIAQMMCSLRCESARYNRAIAGDHHPVTQRILDTLKSGKPVGWDLSPLRHQSWDVYAEISFLIGAACRLEGTECGWDAWSGRERLLAPYMDWNPLTRRFAQRFISRPVPPFYFSRRHLLPLEQHTPYVESYPHGYFLRAEYGETVPGLLRLIHDRYTVFTGESLSPAQHVRPGTPLDEKTLAAFQWLEGDDTQAHWQLLRALALYNALCQAAAKGTDLFCLAY